jgi:hypothetical protein
VTRSAVLADYEPCRAGRHVTRHEPDTGAPIPICIICRTDLETAHEHDPPPEWDEHWEPAETGDQP